MFVIAQAREFALYMPMLDGVFGVLCDLMSHLRHDGMIYIIFTCNLLEKFPKRDNLFNTDMSRTLEDNFCV